MKTYMIKRKGVIKMSANVETMFSVRETPWHGMGTIIEDAPCSDEAIKIACLDWEVKQKPSFVEIDGLHVPTGHIINYRDSDNSILGIVKDQYKVVQNREAFEFTDALIDSGEVRYETAGSLAGGKVVWMLARMPEVSVLGDKVEPYMLFSNSHDGSSAVRCTMTNVRVVCQNTLNLALENARRSWSFVHKGDIKSKLEEARHSLSSAKKYQEEFNRKAEMLVKKTYTNAEVKAIMDKLFPIPEDDKTTLRKLNNMEYLRENFIQAMHQDDIRQFEGTAWGIIQATSDFAYHLRPLRLTHNLQENRMIQAMNGNKMLDMAYKLVA